MRNSSDLYPFKFQDICINLQCTITVRFSLSLHFLLNAEQQTVENPVAVSRLSGPCPPSSQRHAPVD